MPPPSPTWQERRIALTVRMLPYFLKWKHLVGGNLHLHEGPRTTLGTAIRLDAVFLTYGQHRVFGGDSVLQAQAEMRRRVALLHPGHWTLFQEDASSMEKTLRFFTDPQRRPSTRPEQFEAKVEDVAAAILFLQMLAPR